jgi:hypothetical protein
MATLRKLERVMGIEPTLAAWEAAVLPLNYTRLGYGILRYSPGRGPASRLSCATSCSMVMGFENSHP